MRDIMLQSGAERLRCAIFQCITRRFAFEARAFPLERYRVGMEMRRFPRLACVAGRESRVPDAVRRRFACCPRRLRIRCRSPEDRSPARPCKAQRLKQRAGSVAAGFPSGVVSESFQKRAPTGMREQNALPGRPLIRPQPPGPRRLQRCCTILSSTPLTNLWLCSAPKRFASSIASLIATRQGTSFDSVSSQAAIHRMAFSIGST